VYAFYEGNKTIFVGKSDNLKTYLMAHGRPGSGQCYAPIAFGFDSRGGHALEVSVPRGTVGPAVEADQSHNDLRIE
jgi:hypothetical protein